MKSRDDWIRTSDHTHPMRVRYRTALHPVEVAKIEKQFNFIFNLNENFSIACHLTKDPFPKVEF